MLPRNHSIALTGVLFICTLLFINACRHDKSKIDVSQININLVADRLENDIAEHHDNIAFLQQKYGNILYLFSNQLVPIMAHDTNELKSRLNDFIHDSDIVNIYREIKTIFPDVDDANKGLTDAFRHYKYYFPNKVIPRVFTYISGFNYAITRTDSALGIGLDMYFGSDFKYYPSMNLPMYRIRKMSKSYIAADAMKGWAQTEWEQNPQQTDLLSQAIYEGKILYFLNLMMPDAPDSIKTGYTQNQLDWCKVNEQQVWGFFVDHNLLFSTDQIQTAKYVNDGATTNGFPKESPGNIGQFIGFGIVNSYMEQHPEITLEQLLNEKDYKKLFRDSKYKPKK